MADSLPERPAHMTSEWLLSQPKEELVRLIMTYTKRAPVSMSMEGVGDSSDYTPITTRLYRGASDVDTERLLRKDVIIREYMPLPEEVSATGLVPQFRQTSWKVILHAIQTDYPPLGVEIRGDVYIGRAGVGSEPDLDLSLFGGLRHGVSRQHALLRPKAKQLLLVDLGSTNGTYVNGERIRSGSSARIHHNDVIMFGNLTFTVMLPEHVNDSHTLDTGEL